ncbi:MAG TPA: transglutaminaseTgpA domain-containing protein [Candidatus Dormibacteraeota bacterium]
MRRRAPAPPEQRSSAWSAVCVAVLVGNAGLALTTGELVVPLVCSALTVLGYVRSWRRRGAERDRMQAMLVAVALHLALVYLVLDLFDATFGGNLPQAHFALAVAAIISFDLRTRRNLYSHLLMSLVVLYIGGLYAWDVVYLLPVVAWGIATAVFLASVVDRSSPSRGSARPSWRRHGWLAAWLGVSLVLFIAIPEPPGRPLAAPFVIGNPVFAQAQGEALPPALGLVGTDSGAGAINLRARGRLGDEVVFRVRATQPSYWRAYALDDYTGASWTQVSPALTTVSAMGRRIPADPVDPGEPQLSQTFLIDRPIGGSVLAAYPLDELYLSTADVTVLANGTVESPGNLGPGTSYSAVSGVRDLSPDRLRLVPYPVDDPADGWLADARATVHGSSSTARVQGLARTAVAGQATEYDAVEALIRTIQARTRYSLDAPRLTSGEDAVDQFLFVDQTGFCEQYATALAVMLRDVGIPARLAAGYTTGDLDRFTGTYTVHNSDGHAWDEVFFPGVGWVPFDPTPGFDPAAGAGHVGLFLGASGLSALSGSPAALGVAGGLAVLALLAVAAVAAVRRERRLRRLPAVVRPYARSQLWLLVLGLPRRWPAETPGEHLDRIAAACPAAARAMAGLAVAVDDGLYAPAPPRVRPAWRLELAHAGLFAPRSRRGGVAWVRSG